ncbi:MAG: HAD family hydrolase [Acidobacteriota bacterium]|nr:HAD family hydrolase [Acidobacteriota bacterium]
MSGFIFDMDGTLTDSISHYYQVAVEILEMAGAPPVSRERVCELMGTGDPQIVRKLFPADFPDLDATLARIVAERRPTWRDAAHDLQPLPGAVELVRDLDRRGYALGIATSSNRALPYLDRWGIRSLFRSIVGREDVEKRKPHPESVGRCLAELELTPSAAAYVGDSPIDVEAGRAAGATTIAVLSGTSARSQLEAAGPDLILEGVSGIRTILE